MTELQEQHVKELIAALRSGKYSQTCGALLVNSSQGLCFCVMGVACEIGGIKKFVANWPRKPSQPHEVSGFEFPVKDSHLNNHSRIYTGNPNPEWFEEYYGFGIDRHFEGAGLMSWNDRGKSFVEIADMLEKGLGL